MGNDNFTAAPSGTFRTGSGLLNIAANKQEQFEALARALGLDHLLSDPRFSRRDSRRGYRTELTEEIERALLQRSAEEWERVLTAVGVPVGRVLTVPEALKLPQIASRNLLKTFDAAPGVDRPITLALAGFKMSGADPDVATPPPALGQHTDEVLGEVGYGPEDIAALRKAGAL